MATLTVTLTDPESVSTALRALTALSDAPRLPAGSVTEADYEWPASTPTVEDGPVPSGMTYTPILDTPAETASDEPNPEKLDVNGLAWDAEIHSSPPRHNADGSWRARKGRKAEYDAAVKAARAAPAPEQTDSDPHHADSLLPSAEPEPQPDAPEQEPTAPAMPAAPAPTTPEPPVDYEQMARRFMAMMTDGKITDFNAVYQALEIGYNELETNQTMIAALWNYMDALDNGDAHDGAVRHAMGAA